MPGVTNGPDSKIMDNNKVPYAGGSDYRHNYEHLKEIGAD
jgi:hypothetical protein